MNGLFSALVDEFDIPTNALYAMKNRFEAAGEPVIDLISGNPNAHGIQFPQELLQSILQKSVGQAALYQPHPLGQPAARDAIARWYAAQEVNVRSENVILTPGTSLAYWYAFRALANAGDEVLCPAPTYPLFESIARLASVGLRSYPLRASTRWSIDFNAMEEAITPRMRAVILVSPHNPTGSVATQAEVDHLCDIARKHSLTIISDEVFSPFLFKAQTLPRPAAGTAPLVITLNGFSKMLALPGMKLGWMVLTGDPEPVAKCRKILDMLSDTFLPVNEIVQAAVPDLLGESAAFQKDYRDKVFERAMGFEFLRRDSLFRSAIAPEGGFYLSLPLPAGADDEAVALHLLEKERLLTHPGFFYEFELPHLVVSFISEIGEFQEAAFRLRRGVSAFSREV
jgi:aspartate/methionine/tyrosine aminotransferase